MENELFKRKHPDYKALLEYGFKLDQGVYSYQRNLKDEFEAIIEIKEGKLSGKVIDLTFNEEYINYRLSGKLGEFAASIKHAYLDLLEEISEKCFIDDQFIFEQTNQLNKYVCHKYSTEPEFTFEDSDIAIYRHENSKWYGVIMSIDYSKIDNNKKGEIEILNVKIDPESRDELLKYDGIYLCYHMSKKNWISITLDDRLDNKILYQLLDHSYDLIDDHFNYHEWIVPGNAKYYDIEHMFDYTDVQLWKQSTNIHIGDYVYLYASKPYSCVMYRCKVLNVDLPYSITNNLNVVYVMKLQLDRRYPIGLFSLDRLKKYGVTTIRGPRHIPNQLSEDLIQSS